jgi:hypothetical protein
MCACRHGAGFVWQQVACSAIIIWGMHADGAMHMFSSTHPCSCSKAPPHNAHVRVPTMHPLHLHSLFCYKSPAHAL